MTIKSVLDKKIIAISMSFALAASTINLTSFAKPENDDAIVISSFCALPESIREQHLFVGDSFDKIVFPDNLIAYVEMDGGEAASLASSDESAVSLSASSEDSADGAASSSSMDVEESSTASSTEEEPTDEASAGSGSTETASSPSGDNSSEKSDDNSDEKSIESTDDTLSGNDEKAGPENVDSEGHNGVEDGSDSEDLIDITDSSDSEGDEITEDDSDNEDKKVIEENSGSEDDNDNDNNADDNNDGDADKDSDNNSAESNDSAVLSFFKKLFKAGTVFAAEDIDEESEEREKITEEVSISGIEWKLDASLSSSEEFETKEAGEVFVYFPVISDEYKIESDYPTITVYVDEENEEEGAIFEQNSIIDGVSVSVYAPKGVLPEGSRLLVSRASQSEEDQILNAVDKARSGEIKVAVSYSFDIKIIDKDGNEVQPDTSKGEVKVSFSLVEVTNENLDTDVYHVSGDGENFSVSKLYSETSGSEVTATTDGFSFYTVEFTYDRKQYVMEGGTTVPLSEILNEVGLVGNVTDARSSDDDLVSVERDDAGNIIIKSNREFHSLEELEVDIDGITYEIVMTDAVVTAIGGTLIYDDDYNKSASDLVKEILGAGVTAYNESRSGTVYTFTNGSADVGIESGIILDTSGKVSNSINDSDLAPLSSPYSCGGDTSTLEFSLVANGPLLTFNYAFASSEFNQSANFNDSFGLFISINGGAYENIALISRTDGASVPVTIINLRAGVAGTEMTNGAQTQLGGNHSLFTEKSFKLNDTFYINGVSNVFTAQRQVNIGDTIKIKFAICDVSDSSHNSYIFIEAGSLSFNAPEAEIGFINEELDGLDPSALYEITTDDGTVLNITSSGTGAIAIAGTDDNGTVYDLIGKGISIVKKGSGNYGDSPPQDIDIPERPVAQDIDTTSGGISVADDSISITISLSDPGAPAQKYRIYDVGGNEIPGKDWVDAPTDGSPLTFENLDENTVYVIKAWIPATTEHFKSLISDGVQVQTRNTPVDLLEIIVTEPDKKTIVADGEYHSFVCTSDPSDAMLRYSIGDDKNYGYSTPIFKDVGQYLVYYQASKVGYETEYGSMIITILPPEKETIADLDKGDVDSSISSVDVDKLEDYTDEQSGDKVRVKLKVTPRNPEDIDGDIFNSISDKIAGIYDSAVLDNVKKEFLDIDVTRWINDGDGESIHDVERVIEIEMSFDMSDKEDLKVIREHDGEEIVLASLSDRPSDDYVDGTVYFGDDEICIYSRYFSTYVISYVVPEEVIPEPEPEPEPEPVQPPEPKPVPVPKPEPQKEEVREENHEEPRQEEETYEYVPAPVVAKTEPVVVPVGRAPKTSGFYVGKLTGLWILFIEALLSAVLVGAYFLVGRIKKDKLWDKSGWKAICRVGVLLMAVSIALICRLNQDYVKSKAMYDDVQDEYVTTQVKAVSKLIVSENAYSDSAKTVKNANKNGNEWWKLAQVNIEEMSRDYKDVVGWIMFENEDISYPIVYSGDNITYLETAYNGEWANAGAIFVDGMSTPDFEDPNTLIYGHNMGNLTMFGKLKFYENSDDYYDDHKFFQIFTKDKVYRYQIFACKMVPDDHKIYYVYGQDPDHYWSTLSDIIMNADVESRVKPQSLDHIVTLSTCTYDDSMRLVICAARVDEH